MNIIALIITIVAVFLFVTRQIIEYRRFVKINSLKSLYDKMEMFLIKNNVELTNERIWFLKLFKNLTVNPEYLDLQVLVICKIQLDKKGVDLKVKKSNYDKTLNSFPEEFKVFVADFDEVANYLIKLSMFKPDFVLFGLKIVFLRLIKAGFSSLSEISKDYNYIQNNEKVIAYSGLKLA